MKRFLTFILVVALLLAQFAFAETDLVSSNSLFIPDKMIESLNNLFELGLKTNLAALGDVNDEISNLISELAEMFDKSTYGGISLNEEEKAALLADYIKVYDALKEKKKTRRRRVKNT